jgi:DNA-binding SARP family transcriptional activator
MTTTYVALLTGIVTRAGERVRLSARELELLYVLALGGRALPRADIESQLWPDLEEQRAGGRFDVCLHRLRRRLGEMRAIEHSDYGYRLGPNITTDLSEIETFSRTLHGYRSMTAAELTHARAGHAALSGFRVPVSLAFSEVAEAFKRRIAVLTRDFAERIAAHALRTEEFDEALTLARSMIDADVCDEWAWEISIRANLGRDDRSSAILDFRRYAQNLSNELGLRPSPRLEQLLRNAVNSAGAAAASGVVHKPMAGEAQSIETDRMELGGYK